MELKKIEIQNFRSFENFHLEIGQYYNAICGKNNSGKSNLISAIRLLLSNDESLSIDEIEFDSKYDYPIWKSKEITKQTSLCAHLKISSYKDSAIYKFIETFVFNKTDIDYAAKELQADLILKVSYQSPKYEPNINIRFNNDEIDTYKAQEIYKKLKSLNVLVFHNSTEINDGYYFRRKVMSYFSDFAQADKEHIEKRKASLIKTLQNPVKKHQKELSELLGRLEEKYEVGLTVPSLNLERIPLEISLNDKTIDLPLEGWGSGTKNRTFILMSLLNAKRQSEIANNINKVTPIVIIEEPESYLHPSAQAEFGHILQDLSNEFSIQIFSTTHSPYLLSTLNPNSNILLARKKVGAKKFKETYRVNSSEEKWFEPFAQALGVTVQSFEPFKEMFFNENESILLVEGATDKEYFEMLKKEEHGKNKLVFDGYIYDYGGAGNLKNGVLLKFIKEKYNKFIITIDIDQLVNIEKTFLELNLIKDKHYFGVGLNEGGKTSIEGLLPPSIKSKVYSEHFDLVDKAYSSINPEEAKSSRNKLKKIMLEEFKKVAKPNDEYFSEFYKLSKRINKSLK